MALSSVAVTVSSDDPRSVRALAVLATSGTWIKAHLKADGHPFFIIPSSKGDTAYWTDCHACTCPDYGYRGVDCAHIRAVRLWSIQARAQQRRPPTSPHLTCPHRTQPGPTTPQQAVADLAQPGQTPTAYQTGQAARARRQQTRKERASEAAPAPAPTPAPLSDYDKYFPVEEDHVHTGSTCFCMAPPISFGPAVHPLVREKLAADYAMGYDREDD